MKLQVHTTTKDEEAGMFYRSFVGHITVPDGLKLEDSQSRQEARRLALDTLKKACESDYTSLHFAPVGIKVKLEGELSQESLRHLWKIRRLDETCEA